MVLKKGDGIMVNAETLSGGWYKTITYYLILSHFCGIGNFGIGNLWSYLRYVWLKKHQLTRWVGIFNKLVRLLKHMSATHGAMVQTCDRRLFIIKFRKKIIKINRFVSGSGYNWKTLLYFLYLICCLSI